jgi:hypothetical protein
MGVAVGGGVTEGVRLTLGVNELVAGAVTGVGGGPRVDTCVALTPQAETTNAAFNKINNAFFIIHSFESRKQKESVYYGLLSVF